MHSHFPKSSASIDDSPASLKAARISDEMSVDMVTNSATQRRLCRIDVARQLFRFVVFVVSEIRASPSPDPSPKFCLARHDATAGERRPVG
jgi:hypothetical protein